MSKKNRRRYTPGHQLVHVSGNAPSRAELLSKPTSDFEDNPAVKALLKRMAAPDCSDAEAIRIGLALQAVLDPTRALVNNQDLPGVTEHIQRMEDEARKRDRAMEAYDRDREGFVNEVIEHAPKLTGDARNRAIATGVQQYQAALQGATAKQTEQRLRFAYRVEHDPKELVTVPPRYEQRNVGGVVGVYEIPTVLKILDRTFVYPAGQHMMPKIVADTFRNWLSSQQEVAERKSALQKNQNALTLQRNLIQIGSQYGDKNQAPSLLFPSSIDMES